jgi:NitT/TauT family transport system ATP-binding protein
MTEPDIELKDVTLRFPSKRGRQGQLVYENFNLSVEAGSFTVIVGPSGCGKSTLLHVIDGLLKPTQAEAVRVMGLDVRDHPEQTRNIGYVFQNARLLKWKTLRGNVTFGLRGLGLQPKERWDELIDKYFELVGLAGYADHYPREVSGGMQQRAAIVRAWVNEPRVLLMDEPFSHLDEITAESLRQSLVELWTRDEQRRTILFVTHDIDEAVKVGTRVVMLGGSPVVLKHQESVDLPYPRQDDDDVASVTHRVRELFAETRALVP